MSVLHVNFRKISKNCLMWLHAVSLSSARTGSSRRSRRSLSVSADSLAYLREEAAPSFSEIVPDTDRLMGKPHTLMERCWRMARNSIHRLPENRSTEFCSNRDWVQSAYLQERGNCSCLVHRELGLHTVTGYIQLQLFKITTFSA